MTQVQGELFFSDVYDALSDAVRALGGAKAVGAELRPEKPIEEAAKWVKDCLNRERRERFDPEQVLWLLKRARAAGSHGAMSYLAQECGYAVPVPVEPEDERAVLQRDFIRAVELQAQIAARLGVWDKLPGHMRVAK